MRRRWSEDGGELPHSVVSKDYSISLCVECKEKSARCGKDALGCLLARLSAVIPFVVYAHTPLPTRIVISAHHHIGATFLATSAVFGDAICARLSVFTGTRLHVIFVIRVPRALFAFSVRAS